MAESMPEPPNGSFVLVGTVPYQQLAVRDDVAAEEGRRVEMADSPLPVDARWWNTADDGEGPLCWSQFAISGAVVQRLYTEDELTAAVAKVQLRVVGEHIIEAAGYCRSHGVVHSEHEIARAEDREDDHGTA